MSFVLRRWPSALLLVVLVALYSELALRLGALEADALASVSLSEIDAGIPDAGAPDAAALRMPVPREDWRCTGGIAPEMAQLSVDQNGAGVLACYERLAVDPAGSIGALSMDLRVGPEGHVTDAVFAGLSDYRLVDCIQGTLAEWRFPPPVGGECAIVNVPFRLRPPEPE